MLTSELQELRNTLDVANLRQKSDEEERKYDFPCYH